MKKELRALVGAHALGCIFANRCACTSTRVSLQTLNKILNALRLQDSHLQPGPCAHDVALWV